MSQKGDRGSDAHEETESIEGLQAGRPVLDRSLARAGDLFPRTRDAWPRLSAYGRFEEAISVLLTGLIGIVIVAAVINLTFRVIVLVLFGMLDPAEHGVFQAIFGMILTVLIALEFNHSIVGVLERKESMVQVKTVLLIALLALARKFIILDAAKTEPATLIGLAAAMLASGAVYWFVRDREAVDSGTPSRWRR